MTDKALSGNNRRESQRYRISAPLTLLDKKRDIPGFIRDLSNRGVYFYTDLADGSQIGSKLEFIVELPPEITLSTSCLIRCHGRVTRMDRTSKHWTGVAAEILDYKIERDFPPNA